MISELKSSARYSFQICWILVVFHNPVLKTNLEKGMEAYRSHNFQLAYDLFQKSRANYPCLASYGLSTVFANKEAGRYSLDSAYVYAGYALNYWPAMGNKEVSLGLKFNITRQVIEKHAKNVEAAAFEAAMDSSSISMLEHFIDFYVGSDFVVGAARARDSIAYMRALAAGTAAEMLNFMNKYPGADSYKAAQKIYQQLLYKESVVEGDIDSYELFIENFPFSPFLTDAWWNVFRLSTQLSVSPKPYHDFIRDYPGSPLEEEAWFRVQEFYTKSNPNAGFLDFKNAYPAFPDSIIQPYGLVDNPDVLLPFFQSGMFGFMDSVGRVVVDPIYEAASCFSDGLARVRLNGTYGFVNAKGQLVISNQHATATDFSDGFAVVSDNGSMGVIDKRGNTVVPMAYDSVAIAGGNVFGYYMQNKCGFIARDAFQITPPIFLDCGCFDNGSAIVRDKDGFGLVDKSGKSLIQGYERIHSIGNGRYSVLNDGGFAMYDLKGNALTKHVFDGFGVCSEGLFAAALDGKLGFVDSTGRTQIPFIFRYRDGFPENSKLSGGLVAVSLVENVGVADKQGNILIADEFEDVVLIGGGAAAVYENRICRLMQVADESFLTDSEFDSTGLITYGMLPVKGAGGWGLLDSTWKSLVDFQYESIQPVSAQYHVVRLDDKYGVINSSGSIVVDIIYDSFELYHNRFLALGFVGKTEWFDSVSGKLLIPHKE